MKVHPYTRIKPTTSDSVAKHVDMIVEDVDSEIDRITALHNKEFAVHKNSVSTDRLNETFGGSSRNGEDVKFSHELLDTESKLADELQEKFAGISAQLAEYRRRYLEANDKLKELHAKLGEAETKVDTVEDENLKLREELSMGGGGGGISERELARGSGEMVRVNRTGVLSQAELEMNRRSEQIRKALLADEGEDEVAVSMDDLLQSRNLFALLHGWLLAHLPFKRDLRQIQAKFGSSVASYFSFARFVFLQFCGIALLMALFALSHIWSMANRGVPASSYVSHRSAKIPGLVIFSSFIAKEALLYSSVVVLVLVLTGALLAHKIVQEDRRIRNLQAVSDKHSTPHAKLLLCAWDNSLHTRAEVDDLSGSLGIAFLQQLEDTFTKGAQKARSNYEWFVLTARRVWGISSYLTVLCVSGGAIIVLTMSTSLIERTVSDLSGSLKEVSKMVAPVGLAAVNAVVPVFLQFITRQERWDTAHQELNVLMFRIYVSNTFNSAILGLTFLLLVDPSLFEGVANIRESMAPDFLRGRLYDCRYDQAADGLFTLVLVTWVLKNGSLLAMPLAMRFYHERIRGRPWVREQFDVAENMVKQLNFIGLAFMCFPFAPLTMLFLPPALLVSFKWEKYCLKRYYVKPHRIGTGEKAGLTFAAFYLVTFVVQGCVVGFYFLSSKTLPKDCAFRSGDSAECLFACGAFQRSTSNVEPFKHFVLATPVLGVAWRVVFDHPYIPWLAAVSLAIVIAVQANALDVAKLAAYTRERRMETHIATIDAERKKQERTIQRLKTIEGGEGGGGEVEPAAPGEEDGGGGGVVSAFR